MVSDDNIAGQRWQERRRRLIPFTTGTTGLKKYLFITIFFVEFSHSLTSRPNAENLIIPQHQPLSSLSAENSNKYVDNCSNEKVQKLLQKANITWNKVKMEPLECPGFCNKVYNIEEVLDDEKMTGRKQQTLTDYTTKHDNHKMVAKIFSPLAKQRMDPSVRIGYVDKMASDNGLGPKLLASSDDGILMESLKGFTLTDIILHGNDSEELCQAIGKLVAQFHGMDNNLVMPNDYDDETSTTESRVRQTNMLWYSIDAMFSIMIANDPNLSLKTHHGDTGNKVEWTIPKLQNEVNRLRICIEEKLHLPCVLGHGDLKPSNIIVQSSNECGVSVLDFELSGLAYRGFDIAKIFRAIEPIPFNQNNYNAFLAAYTDETIRLSSSLSILRDEMNACLPLEAQIMLPLTWLEAAIFFLCSSSVDPLNSQRWNEMASKRLESYDKYIGEFECHVEAYYEMMKRK